MDDSSLPGDSQWWEGNWHPVELGLLDRSVKVIHDDRWDCGLVSRVVDRAGSTTSV